MLDKTSLIQQLQDGILEIYTNRLNDTDEDGNPSNIIRVSAEDLANVIADAVEAYVKSGSVSVGPTNISVTCTALGSPGVVTTLNPAKIT